jgi:hypothetical protein
MMQSMLGVGALGAWLGMLFGAGSRGFVVPGFMMFDGRLGMVYHRPAQVGMGHKALAGFRPDGFDAGGKHVMELAEFVRGPDDDFHVLGALFLKQGFGDGGEQLHDAGNRILVDLQHFLMIEKGSGVERRNGFGAKRAEGFSRPVDEGVKALNHGFPVPDKLITHFGDQSGMPLNILVINAFQESGGVLIQVQDKVNGVFDDVTIESKHFVGETMRRMTGLFTAKGIFFGAGNQRSGPKNLLEGFFKHPSEFDLGLLEILNGTIDGFHDIPGKNLIVLGHFPIQQSFIGGSEKADGMIHDFTVHTNHSGRVEHVGNVSGKRFCGGLGKISPDVVQFGDSDFLFTMEIGANLGDFFNILRSNRARFSHPDKIPQIFVHGVEEAESMFESFASVPKDLGPVDGGGHGS